MLREAEGTQPNFTPDRLGYPQGPRRNFTRIEAALSD